MKNAKVCGKVFMKLPLIQKYIQAIVFIAGLKFKRTFILECFMQKVFMAWVRVTFISCSRINCKFSVVILKLNKVIFSRTFIQAYLLFMQCSALSRQKPANHFNRFKCSKDIQAKLHQAAITLINIKHCKLEHSYLCKF